MARPGQGPDPALLPLPTQVQEYTNELTAWLGQLNTAPNLGDQSKALPHYKQARDQLTL